MHKKAVGEDRQKYSTANIDEKMTKVLWWHSKQKYFIANISTNYILFNVKSRSYDIIFHSLGTAWIVSNILMWEIDYIFAAISIQCQTSLIKNCVGVLKMLY